MVILASNQPSGSYWITISGTAVQVRCENSVNGGGWQVLGYTSTQVNWLPFGGPWYNQYTYGTYDVTGSTTLTQYGYLMDYRPQQFSEVMFMTGNKQYYQSISLSSFNSCKAQGGFAIPVMSTSNNFESSVSSRNLNNYMYILWRGGGGEDPWINTGTSHSNGANPNHMWWAGNNYGLGAEWKNANGGSFFLMR